MSVVAGCSLFNGVLIAADCRATIKRKNHNAVYSDNVLKVFALLPNTAIGFVGDIDVASYLLQRIISQLKKLNHTNPISLACWLPRLFRYEFTKYTSQYGNRAVHFMIAGILKGRRNIVERKKVLDIVKYITSGDSPIGRSWMPNILVDILKVPSEYKWVEIPNSSQGILYVLTSPDFRIKPFHPLQFTAIGSGGSSIKEVELYHDSIFALDPGNSFVEGQHFREVIRTYIKKNKIKSVGGLYPALKVTGAGIEHLSMSSTIPVGGTKIDIAFQSGQWIQRNNSTDKEIPILMPWDFLKGHSLNNNMFDDLDDAFNQFRG